MLRTPIIEVDKYHWALHMKTVYRSGSCRVSINHSSFGRKIEGREKNNNKQNTTEALYVSANIALTPSAKSIKSYRSGISRFALQVGNRSDGGSSASWCKFFAARGAGYGCNSGLAWACMHKLVFSFLFYSLFVSAFWLFGCLCFSF